MAQLAPTILDYAQLMALVEEFVRDYTESETTDIATITEHVHDIITKFNDIGGKPLLDFEEVQLGEPPSSEKMNRIWTRLQNDINIMEDQLDVLRAAVIFVHNFIATEIQLAKNQNAQASNKLKTLQLYTTAHDSNILQFGDYFQNLDFLDLALIPNDQKVSLLSPGVISLARETQNTNLSVESDLRILDTSNGIAGNNQEITDPTNAVSDPVDNQPLYIFKAQVSGRHADTDAIIDGEPNTWFEYESYLVNSADRQSAKDLNFVYRKSGGNNDDDTGLVDWAQGPSNGILKLDLEFDLNENKIINSITLTPFGLEQNKNYPVKISLVQTSTDGTNWTSVAPQNVYIATDANLQSARTADNVYIGQALYTFDERTVRYVRFSIEQREAVDCNIGHLYYETKKTVKTERKTVPNPDNPGTTMTVDIPVTSGGDRVEGPIPPLSEPDRYYGKNGLINGNLVQKTEFFKGKRWAIGIRDILIEESLYKPTSMMISKPFKVGGVVDRVSLDADTFIPTNFPSDGTLWVKFFISPNDGLNWYPISRIQDDFLGIPEIIAFNDPLPAEFREIGVQYINTNSVVNNLRVKIELSRPTDLVSSSPIVKSYKLKVRRR